MPGLLQLGFDQCAEDAADWGLKQESSEGQRE